MARYPTLEGFNFELSYCDGFDETFDLLSATMSQFGFPYISYAFCGWQLFPRLSDEIWFKTSFPEKLNQAYLYRRAVDHDLSIAALRRAKSKNGFRFYGYSNSIFFWDMLDRAVEFDMIKGKALELIELAADQNVHNGFSVAFKTRSPSFAGSGVVAPSWMSAEHLRWFMQMNGKTVVEIFQAFHNFCISFSFPGPNQELTDKEKRLIKILPEHASIRICANELGIEYEAARKRLRNARERLFVPSNLGLVLKAERQRQV